MADINPLADGPATFQLQAARTERQLSTVRSTASQAANTGDALGKASQQFEALLLNIMIKEMRATVPESELFPRTMADEIFTAMLDEQYADVMAQRGGLGLSRMVVDQLANRDAVSGKVEEAPVISEKLK